VALCGIQPNLPLLFFCTGENDSQCFAGNTNFLELALLHREELINHYILGGQLGEHILQHPLNSLPRKISAV
jgi:hypothetical protein